jgi:hypothetical protein
VVTVRDGSVDEQGDGDQQRPRGDGDLPHRPSVSPPHLNQPRSLNYGTQMFVT